jgi:hypothetical protein
VTTNFKLIQSKLFLADPQAWDTQAVGLLAQKWTVADITTPTVAREIGANKNKN